jgi:hypothetical protein
MAHEPETLDDLGITPSRQRLLTVLAEIEGYPNVIKMLEAATFDSIAPGICPRCHYSIEVEPDSGSGWCEECETQSVKSCLVLAGII